MSYFDDDGSLTAEGMQRIMVEVSLGIPPVDSALPDDPAVRDFRDRVTPQIVAIQDDGQVLELDAEFPG